MDRAAAYSQDEDFLKNSIAEDFEAPDKGELEEEDKEIANRDDVNRDDANDDHAKVENAYDSSPEQKLMV